MNTRRLAHPGRIRTTACTAVLGLALLSSPVLAGAATAATRSAAPAGSNRISVSASRPATAVALPNGFRPEGIASGPNQTYYAGSLADGRIWTGTLRTRGQQHGHELTAAVPGRSLRGLELDRRSNLLWAAGQDGDTGIVLAVDASTGAIVHRIVVPEAVFLNDLTVEPNAVWVTDSRADRLTRIGLHSSDGSYADRLDIIPLTGDWPTTPADGIRANGIDTLWDGTLLLNHSSAGGLWQVSPHTGVAHQIPVRSGPGITGGDGLVRKGHTVFVVRGSGNNQVDMLKLHHNRRGWRATWRRALGSPMLDVPSTTALVHHVLWTVNARFGVSEPATAAYQIVPVRR